MHNSFQSPYSVNAIDWNNKALFKDQFDYYAALARLRRNHPAFRMTSASDIARHIVFDKIDSSKQPNLISYSLVRCV